MAHIASINGSTASPPPSQIALSAPDTAEQGFLSLLSNAATKSIHAGSQDAGKLFTAQAAKSVAGQASDLFSDRLRQKIQSLLDKGISFTKITQALATKLVAAGDAKGAPDPKKVSAVVNYLNSGEVDSRDTATTAKNIAAKVKTLLAATQPAGDGKLATDSGNILDALQAGETPTTLQLDSLDLAPGANSNAPKIVTSEDQTNAQVPSQTQSVVTVTDPALLAAAVQALQAPAKPSTTEATALPSTAAAPAATVATAASSDTAKLAASADATVPQVPTTDQPQTRPADDAQAAAAGAADQQARQAQAAATTAIAIQTAAAAPDPTQQQTLGQLAQASLLNVGTELHAIASGQGTELGRALIRAANVDISRSTATATRGDQTLASLTAALDDLWKSVDPKSSQQDTPSEQKAFDSSLGGAALGLSGGVATATAQTGFAGTLKSVAGPVHPEDVMDQVVHGLSIKNFASNPTVKIALNPQQLGEIEIKLTVTNDTVHASVVAQSHEVRNILLDNKLQLDQVLAQAGLKLGSLQVDVNGQSTQQDAERRQTQRDQIFASRQSIGKSDTDVEPMQTAGPSLLGSVNISLLNQLA